jgi:hypothetical protein
VRSSACALIVVCSSLGLLRAVPAADAPVDDGLLEFLGSVDSDDKDWHDYLAGTDIDQVARRAGNGPPPKPPAPPASAGAPPAADPPAAGTSPPLAHP